MAARPTRADRACLASRQTQEQTEQQRQREQQQRQDQRKQDQGGKKQGFDKDQDPQKAGVTDNSQRS